MQRPYLTGVGMLGSLDQSNYDTLTGWDDPNVSFCRGRFGWNTIQPTSSTFNWTPIDNLAAKAAAKGKKYSFNVGAGRLTPQWVYDAGAIKYQYHDNHEAPVDYEPLPWDLVFQSKYFPLIDAIVDRFGTDPNFVLYWINGFQAEGDMSFGSAGDELNMPHSGYATVDLAYVAGAKAVITKTMSAFRQLALVNYVRPFPTSSGSTAGQTVKDFLIDTYPAIGGTGVSAIFAVSPFGSPAKAMQNGHGFPHGGQQVQPTTLNNGNVNPNCYSSGYSGQLHPVPFQDMVGNALALRNTFMETYENDLANTAIQAILATVKAQFEANVP